MQSLTSDQILGSAAPVTASRPCIRLEVTNLEGAPATVSFDLPADEVLTWCDPATLRLAVLRALPDILETLRHETAKVVSERW